MNALKKLLLSDNIILSDQTLKEYQKIIDKAITEDEYSFTFSDYYSGDRRLIFVDEITKQIRKSYLAPIILSRGFINVTEDYTLIIAKALRYGYTDIREFLLGDVNNLELTVYLFLLNDMIFPSTLGFVTLKKRIVATVEAIMLQKKSKLADFKLNDVFADIRDNESPAKTRKTDSQMMVRALKYSTLFAESGETLTPVSYVPLAAITIYNNNSDDENHRKIVSACNSVFCAWNIRNKVMHTRLTEVVLFALQERTATYDDIRKHIENVFCVSSFFRRCWYEERKKPHLKELRKLLKRKYGKDGEKVLIREAIHQVKLNLGIIEDDLINTNMRGE